MSLSKPLTLRHLCHLLNNIIGLFYHRHIVFFTISLVKNTKCCLPKKHLKELRTCPECKNRYAKHTCIKALLHGAIFLATCNAILVLVDVKLANTRFHHAQFANVFLHIKHSALICMAVGLRCTLPGKLHRVTGPLAHHVVLNHTLELLVSINRWNYKQMYSASKHKHT